jgi:hypothetical protein
MVMSPARSFAQAVGTLWNGFDVEIFMFSKRVAGH